MIAFIEGPVRLIRKDSIAISIQGLGYEVFVASPEKFRLDQPVFLYTYQQIREDANLLYGFESLEDYDLFVQLLNVKGIGCRMALNAFKALPASRIGEAIENQDVKTLKSLPGIGAKTASQIILDLKGKIAPIPEVKTEGESHPLWTETALALEALGYKDSVISRVKKALSGRSDITDVSGMVKEALQLIASRRI